MSDGLRQLVLKEAQDWFRRRALKRRRPSVNKKRKLIYQFILLALLSIIVAGLYFILHTDKSRMRWGFILAGMIASCVGVVFSLTAAWRSSIAEERTEYLLDKLEETQRIVSESPTDYVDVFDVHVLRPMQRASDPVDRGDQLRRLEMHISTPAYGYHVLGFNRHFEFRSLLDALRCQKQIVFFSPDAHFFHVANTLLWYPLKALISNDDNVSNKTPREATAKKVNPKTLAKCIVDTMDMLRLQVLQAEQESARHASSEEEEKEAKVSVWTSNTTEFRLTAFRFETETRAFLLLTDQVTLASDLEQFHGRALALPVAIHRQVVGDPGDRESFFEQLKTCPYSGETHEQARLRSTEFDALKWDYLFLRTGHAVIDLYIFNIQCRQVIWAKEPQDEGRRITVAREILEGLVEYFAFMKTEGRDPRYAPSGSIQEKRLLQIEAVSVELNKEDATGEQILGVLRKASLHENDTFKRELSEFDTHIAELGADFIGLSNWISCIYYFVSSGFHQSLFAAARRERAPHLKPSPAERTGDEPVVPMDAVEYSSQSAADFPSTNDEAAPALLAAPAAMPDMADEFSDQTDRTPETTTNKHLASNQVVTEGDSDDESQTVDT